MNEKAMLYALVIGAFAIVGLIFYGAFFSSTDPQETGGSTKVTGKAVRNALLDEKSYELRAAEITAIQWRINQLTRKTFDFYEEPSASQCYIIKMASDDTKENHDLLASLTAPPAFQRKHETLLAYLSNTYKMWVAYYNECISYAESDKKYYAGEVVDYSVKASELLTSELVPWMQELDLKYPKETAALYQKYHP